MTGGVRATVRAAAVRRTAGFVRAALAGVALSTAVTACSLSGHHASTTTTTQAPVSTTVARTSTTIPGVQASGTRTVLSPIGLNVRAHAAKTAKVLGTASQGAQLTVLGYSAVDGGWYLVHGETVTGWISSNATLSAAGTFQVYSAPANLDFSSLYPTTWTVRQTPHTAVFSAPTGVESITVGVAPTEAKLSQGHTGYALYRSEQIVVCGVTTELSSYTAPGVGSRYLAQIRLTVDATHALGIYGNLTSASQLPTVRNFANSMSFPAPQCQGK